MSFNGVPAAFFVENLFPQPCKTGEAACHEVKDQIRPGQGQKTHVLPAPFQEDEF